MTFYTIKNNTVIITIAIIYSILNIFFIGKGLLIIDLLITIILLLSFYSYKSIFIPVSILSILFFSANFNFLITGIYFSFYMIYIFRNLRSIQSFEFYILIILFITFLQTIFVGGDYTYGFVKTLVLFGLPSFYFLFSKYLKRYKINSTSISIVYITITLTQIIYAFYINPGSRLSIFHGSENIALILITILYLSSFERNSSILIKSINLLLFALFIFSTESRSGFLIILLILVFLIFKKKISSLKYLTKLTIFIPLIILLPIIYISEIKAIPLFNRIKPLIDLASSFGFDSVTDYYNTDLRGLVYNEGFSLWLKNPIFGNGAKPSPILSSINAFPVYNFHSSLIDILVQYGIFGLVSIVGIFYFLIGSIRQVVKSNFILIYFLIFIMSSLVQPYLFNIKVISLFSLALFIIVYKEKEN